MGNFKPIKDNNIPNAEMLTLARRSRGLNQTRLSKLVGIPQSIVSRYEAGVIVITDVHLERFSTALDYPVRFFLRQDAPVGGVFSDSIYHRQRQSAPATLRDKAYATAAVRRMEATRLLLSFPYERTPPLYPIEEYPDPARVARTVRACWGCPTGPIINMTRLLEDFGCMIFAHSFGTRHIDGFSIFPPDRPAFIHMNASLPPDRWRWTLAHELGHIVMHDGPGRESPEAEQEANAFAAEFLTPRNELIPMLHSLNIPRLAGLKLEWKVSMQSLVMQAAQCGTITQEHKRRLFAQMSKEGWRTREPEHLDPPVEQPRLPSKMALFYFTELDFSKTELLDYLSIGENDFSTFYEYADNSWKEMVANKSDEWTLPQ